MIPGIAIIGQFGDSGILGIRTQELGARNGSPRKAGTWKERVERIGHSLAEAINRGLIAYT